MNQVVHRQAGDEERESGVYTMGPGNGEPCCSEAFSGLGAVWGILQVPFGATEGPFSLICRGKFDYVGDEEVARNE